MAENPTNYEGSQTKDPRCSTNEKEEKSKQITPKPTVKPTETLERNSSRLLSTNSESQKTWSDSFNTLEERIVHLKKE